MSALDEIRKNLGASQPSLKSDLNTKGTTQPVTQQKSTSALEAIRANLNTSSVVTPQAVTTQKEEKGLYEKYSDQVKRKSMSWNAGIVESAGQLLRSAQWVGDRLVGDFVTRGASDKLFESEQKAQDDMLKIYRDRKAKGDTVGAKKILDQLNKSGFTPYQAYADTTDSVFYKAQDKTKEWADILKKSAGITQENSTFSDRLFEGAGSSAVYFVPSMGVMKGASVIAKVSPKVAMLFAGSASASLEAMAEAGATFDEVKKNTGDLQQATEQSSKVFLANAILLGISNRLGIFSPEKLGFIKRALLSAPIEGLQEASQQAIQNLAEGKPVWDGVLESGAIGAIVGTVMGGAVDIITSEPNVKTGSKKTPEPPKSSQEVVSPALQALRQKLNITPAIEQQRALEGETTPPPPSPTAQQTPKVDIQEETVLQGEGKGSEVKVELPVNKEETSVIDIVEEYIKRADEKDQAFLKEATKKIDNLETTAEEVKKLITETKRKGYDDVARYLEMMSEGNTKIEVSQEEKTKIFGEEKTKRIGLLDSSDTYTPRMKELIKEAQENGDTFPYTKMTPEEQKIVDDAFNRMLSEVPVKTPKNFRPYEATITSGTVDKKRLSDPAYFKEVYESTFAVGGDKALYKIMTKELVPEGREASGYLADLYQKAKTETSKKTSEVDVDEAVDKMVTALTTRYPEGVTLYHQTSKKNKEAIEKKGFVGDKNDEVYFSLGTYEKNRGTNSDNSGVVEIQIKPDDYDIIGLDRGTYEGSTEAEQYISLAKAIKKGEDSLDVTLLTEDANRLIKQQETTVEEKPDILSKEDMDSLKGDIESALSEADMLDEIKIVNVEQFGSTTTGKQRKDSDYDIKVLYTGDVREDDVHNALYNYNEENNLEVNGRKIDFTAEKTTTKNRPETGEEASERYWNEVIQPRIEKGEAVIIGADDLKDHFNNDYDDAHHPIYSRGAFLLYERALKEVDKSKDVALTGGGAGSGKTEILVKTLIGEGFNGILYDSNMANFDGAKKQIELAKEDGRTTIRVYGITPNLESARRFTVIRENNIGRGISDKTFARGHAGFPNVLQKLLEENVLNSTDVFVLDTRGQVTLQEAKDMVRNGAFVKQPLDFIKKLGYNEEDVKNNYSKDRFTEGDSPKTSDTRSEGTPSKKVDRSPRESGADKEVVSTNKGELRLEAQPVPTEKQSRTQTEVQGEKVNRFTGIPQENANPRVLGQQKPLVTKAKLKVILDTTPDFKANPVLTVEEIKWTNGNMKKVFAWNGGKTQFTIYPEALGIVTGNLQIGDQVKISSETFKGTGQELRVIKYDEKTGAGSKYASVGRYRDDTEIFLSDPSKIKSIQFPELVGLAKELSGNVPFLRKYQKANGMFYGKGSGEIGLHPSLFEKGNLRQLQATLAHEIGHLIDYLPDGVMARGNLMGRLNTLKGFRSDFFAEAGTSRTDKELRTQMYELSKYWRPYDETLATDSFIAYRKSAPEIYADFISALFNEPRTVSSIAPTAYNIFFQQLDKKPKVKQAYFELQEILRNGDLVAKRRSATNEMFKLTEQESRERQIQNEIEHESREKSIWFKFKTQAVDITEVIKDKVKKTEEKGTYINPDDNPVYYLEERNYLGGKIKAEVDTKFNTIYQELQKDGMTWEDLGEMMFYERVLKGDRQEVANPLGYQPDFVQELMEVYEDVGSVQEDKLAYDEGTSNMKAELGEDKYRKLQALAVEYRENLKGFFIDGRKEGIYSEELEKMFNDNAFYVPFKGAKYSGVSKTTFGVKHQKGTLGNIENPANTGIEKAVSIIRAIERNKVTRKTIDFLQEFHSEEVTQAPTDKNGYPMQPKDRDFDLVTYMQDGKVKGFHVDKYIADAIKKNTIAEQNMLISSIRFWNSGLFRPLFITFNLGFQGFNAIRDFKRFWKNVPNMTILKAMKLYAQSARASKIRAFGLPKNHSKADQEAYDLINKLEEDQILSITYNDIIKGEAIEDAQIERILREVGVREAQDTKLGKIGSKIGLTKNIPLIKQAFQIMDFIEKTGNMIETLPKVAGVKALEGKMPPREMRSFVRKYVGSPDFLAGGKFKPYMNEVFLFSNAIFQGIRSDYEISTQPKTRGAYWLKTAQSELLPKMLMLMAVAGYFGDYLKELFNKVGEYDLTNYTIVPIGVDENGKAVYFRMPSDETGRLIGGTFWKIANSVKDPEKLATLETYTDLLAYAGGQVPSISPVVELGAFTIPTFLAGNNPYDFFRGRQVLTDDQQTAGGMERVKPFLSYMFQQLGGSVFMKLYYNETVPKNPSLSEKIVNLPVVSNIAGRFIKVSDYGEVEKVREVSSQVRSERAREGIKNRRVVFDYVSQAQGKNYGEIQALKKAMILEIYGGFPQTPEERTQAKSLEKRFDTLNLRGSADARVDALVVAESNEEKVALLREYKKTMSKEDFEDLKKFIIQNRVVSSSVFQRFYSGEK